MIGKFSMVRDLAHRRLTDFTSGFFFNEEATAELHLSTRLVIHSLLTGIARADLRHAAIAGHAPFDGSLAHFIEKLLCH